MTEDPRISEIRAALAVFDADAAVPLEYLADTVRAVLKDDPPPAPRVFFPGDMVPEDTLTINKRGYWGIVGLKYTTEDIRVEVPTPTREEWQAAVDRARAEREADLRADRHAEITEAEASEARLD